MRVLITGAAGLVGRALVEHCTAQHDEVLAHEHLSLDITDLRQVGETFRRERPEAAINCAAWTDVDGCEFDPAKAREVNAFGPENLAIACREVGARLVTISTDYVFDGEKEGFYTQQDDPNPQSVYAMAKLEGEQRALRSCARTIVVRTGFIFGRGGKNFLSTVVDRARRGERLRAISDSYGTPTSSRDLAARLRELAQLDIPGIYHVVNSGDGVNYMDFAQAALSEAGISSAAVESVLTESIDRPARRPRNSRLRCLLSAAVGLPPLPFWRDALQDFVQPSARH